MFLNMVRAATARYVLRLVVTAAVALATILAVPNPATAIDYDEAHPVRAFVGYGRVYTPSGAPLRLRSEPSTGSHSRVIDKLPSGTVIKYRCFIRAQTVDGPFGPSDIWYGTRRGFLPQAYLRWDVPGSDTGTPPRCGDEPAPDNADKRPVCRLGGSREEIYELFFGRSCVPPDVFRSPDPGDRAFPSSFAGQTPVLLLGIGPHAEDSLGLVWDGCSVPWQAVVLPGMGHDVSTPFGFNFRKACEVHDLGYRLVDRHILPESAEQPLDDYFGSMLGHVCRLYYSNRLPACMEVAAAYSTAVHLADHQPKPDSYPRRSIPPR